VSSSARQEAARSSGLRVVQEDASEENRQLPARDTRICAVDVVEAVLNYPIGPYVRGSLKSSLMSLIGHREQTVAPQFVEAIRNLTISFAQGERVALIGRNGSGKSTLLRALAGIYPLKHGTIRVIGQIGTLLDIGAGFEMESTGRENIYYRGMAMGFSRATLRKVESEIVEFADLGEFIDLPMRTYSAGMQVRLGFGVSTQISPDVLLIDEVFGAGDAQFAHKAFRRIMDLVQRSGIMVLATHDLGLVETLCTRTIWLDQGIVVRDGPPSVVVPQFSAYMRGEMEI
jgi:lipopolysaccharide transport system ATP-binding protein